MRHTMMRLQMGPSPLDIFVSAHVAMAFGALEERMDTMRRPGAEIPS
jgi:hypothetical protein